MEPLSVLAEWMANGATLDGQQRWLYCPFSHGYEEIPETG